MKSARFLLAAAAIFGLTVPAHAGGKPVVELFTSQSCYSCPPAEAYLGELAKRGDVIALEYHVDYWDDLVYGLAGRWKDVFSDPAFTARQRAYNIAIRSRGQVYTPQMIVGGTMQTVGSNRGAVEQAIRMAKRAKDSGIDVDVTRRSGGGLAVAVNGEAKASAGVWLVRFERARTTQVKAGENKGKTLTNYHAVREVRRIGAWSGGSKSYDVADLVLASGEGCAVLVQDERPGPILGAAECPATVTN